MSKHHDTHHDAHHHEHDHGKHHDKHKHGHDILQKLECIRPHVQGADAERLNACCAKLGTALQTSEGDKTKHESLVTEALREAGEILEKYAKYV